MSQNITRSEFKIDGMRELGCGRAEQALLALSGVLSAQASFSAGAVAVQYDADVIALGKLTAALVKAGYSLAVSGGEAAPEPLPPTLATLAPEKESAPGKAKKPPQTSGAEKAVKATFGVEGMTCAGCEAKVERILRRQKGVTQARASFSANTVAVEYDPGQAGFEGMASALTKAGYRLRDAKASAGGAKKFNAGQFVGLVLILFAVYFIISKTIGFNFIPTVDKNTSYGVLFLIGLLTSLHCVAMCGGINLSQCVARSPEAGAKSKLMPSLQYNAGRVVSYTAVGGVVGALGSVISFSGWMRGAVAILAGVFMALMGLSMLGIFPWLNKITPRMPKFLRSAAGAAGRGRGPFVVGLLNGLMPCGPLQAMQIYALGTGSALAGALSMLLFSLGTVPLMFGLGALSSLLSNKFTSRIMKVSAALVLLLGLVMVNRGLALSGVSIMPESPAKAGQSQQTTASGGVQRITTKLTANSYPVLTVQKGIPVQWDLQADAATLNGCNGTVVIPKFNIEKKLQPGDNIIEFTPTQAGTVPYSCWMGMIKSRIVVVDGPAATATQEASGASAGAASLSGGCCAGAGTATGFAGGKIPMDQIAVASTENGVQVVTVTVDNEGYSPAVAVVQKGVKTKIRFVAKQLSSCNSTVYFPDFSGSLDLSSGQLETPELTPQSDFTFECGMGMLHGYVKVVTDINNINLDDIRKDVAAWTPPAGSGGCCG